MIYNDILTHKTIAQKAELDPKLQEFCFQKRNNAFCLSGK